jgi:two-component system, OmpR family, sensor kinase
MTRGLSTGTLYRQVYLHGVRLLLLVAMSLGLAGFFLGRDVHWRFQPAHLAQHVAGLLASLPEAGLAVPVARLASELEVSVAVYADDGRRLASAGDQVVGPLSADELARLRLSEGTQRQGHRLASVTAGPGRYVRIMTPRPNKAVWLRFLGSLVLVVLVLAVASAPLARAIVRPIEHLSRVARRLGEGDLAARADLGRGDEIGHLARTLDEMAERLGRLLEGQRELLANVSHELRTPLARMRVAMALAAEAEPAEARRHLHEMEQDVVELETLVADVLTATRLDGGGSLVLRRERIDPSHLLEQAVERFARQHPDRTLQVVREAAPALDAEEALLGRALFNLLDNAAKYSPAEAPVVLELRARDGGAVLTVRDQGVGIAPDDLPRVFTPFFRGDRSRTRDTGGIGLGLALAKRIVEAHGGRVALESALNKGTTVTLWLPAAPDL